MDFTIREVREGDAESCMALFNAIIEEGKYTALTEPFTVEKQLDLIHLCLSKGTYQVAVTTDDRVVGIQVVLPLSELPAFSHVGDIGTYVDTSAHRQGVARALSEATFRNAKEKGFAKIMAMIRGDNLRAQAFYESIGFEPIGVAKRQARIRGEFFDEMLNEKFL